MVSRSCISGYGTNFVPALNIHRAAGAAGAGLRPARGRGAAARALLVLAAHARGLGRLAGRPGAAAVREPKILRSGEIQVPGVDLSVLQPLLRAVAPDLGMAAPVVRLRDSLAPLQLRLELPVDASGSWPLTVTPDDPALWRRAAHV